MEKIGSGGQATVYKAVLKNPNQRSNYKKTDGSIG
jgi:hypothetical protein